MARKKTVTKVIPELQDLVKTIYMGDIMRYFNENPETSAEIRDIANHYTSLGYKISNY